MALLNDSARPRRVGRRVATAGLLLLTCVGWSHHVNAASPHTGGAGAAVGVGAGSVIGSLAIDPHTPTTLYAGTQCSGVLKSLDGGDSWAVVNAGLETSEGGLVIDPMTTTMLYAS